ncbi:unnamed protein product [Spodoptera exigua]|nr:unnamed protein product [Spodoptera exigua]
MHYNFGFIKYFFVLHVVPTILYDYINVYNFATP